MKWSMRLHDREALAQVKEAVERGDSRYAAAYQTLLSQAEDALLEKPSSVMDKGTIPPSGDKHDYISYGSYYWPNPATPDGLPYINKDGERNPIGEGDLFDKVAQKKMWKRVRALSMAYYFSGDERYASYAMTLLRAWYLDEETHMNPHLNYGQMIPGICEGRFIGIVDTRLLGHLADFISLLTGSSAWRKEDGEGLRSWFREYMLWLAHGEFGKLESEQNSNHGTYYDVQTAALALHAGEEQIARDIVLQAPVKRFRAQIESDGSQPKELKRTKALNYSLMNLNGFADLAMMGRGFGMDLWNPHSEDGKYLRAAFDFLAHYLEGNEPWPYKQIIPLEPERVFKAYKTAAYMYNEPRYERVLQRFEQMDIRSHPIQLLYPCID